MFIKINRAMRKVLGDKKGATMVEYALLAGLIAAVAAATIGTLGGTVNSKFSSINTSL